MQHLTAVLLVGGLGTRLRQLVPTTPKPLAMVGKGSFLELLVCQLRQQGIRRVVMCTGYLGEQIQQEFGTGKSWGIDIQYSHEAHPLGTAGAVKFAESLMGGVSDFLVMNGDSFIEMDFHEFYQFHCERSGIATLAVRRADNASRYGKVEVGSNGKVLGFSEKPESAAPGLVNAGVYVFNRAALRHIDASPSSLERDVFPNLVRYGVFALEERGAFIDIGTPEDYLRAQEMCDSLYHAALHPRYSD